MPADQKLSELPIASAISNSDACLLVSNGADYQLAMSLLLQYVGTNLTVGATLSFGALLPQNTAGKNGDVFVNTVTGVMAQKLSGTWTITYTPSVTSSASGNTILYGLGVPSTIVGSNGDTYINTGSGIFYKKITIAGARYSPCKVAPPAFRDQKVTLALPVQMATAY